MQTLQIILVTLFVVICILLIIVVLLQKGRGGGLGAAFGGVGTTAFGTKTGDVFTWVTIILTVLFVLLSIAAAIAIRPGQTAAARPEFIPPEGPISTETPVSISAPGRDVAVHYTTDGSEPTETSPRYQKSPVMVKPGTVLKARTYQPGRLASPVVSGFYGRPQTQPAAPAATSEPAAATSPGA
jgi:preprotein translocase subunit SecG